MASDDNLHEIEEDAEEDDLEQQDQGVEDDGNDEQTQMRADVRPVAFMDHQSEQTITEQQTVIELEDDLISQGELEDDMQGMSGAYQIKIVYTDHTLKQVKSSKLKRLDQIINYNAEMQMLKYRREMRQTNLEYREWSTFW